MDFSAYDPEAFYDELFDGPGRPRPGMQLLVERIESLPPGELVRCQKAAEAALLQMGITFTVYGEEAGTERIWPFDLIPRIVTAKELLPWAFGSRKWALEGKPVPPGVRLGQAGGV